MSESQRVRDQKALTSSTGRSWLVLGAVLTALCGGLLAAMWNLPSAGMVIVGCAIIVALYLVMIVVRLTMRRRRTRLITMAALTILSPVTFFICAAFIGASARAP